LKLFQNIIILKMVNKEQILLRLSEEEIFKRYTGKS
jgi:hypothetical protein